jgi:hypothetical protein
MKPTFSHFLKRRLIIYLICSVVGWTLGVKALFQSAGSSVKATTDNQISKQQIIDSSDIDVALAGISRHRKDTLDSNLRYLAVNDPKQLLKWLDKQKTKPDRDLLKLILDKAGGNEAILADLCKDCSPELAGALASEAILHDYHTNGIAKALDLHSRLKNYTQATPVLEQLFKDAVAINDPIYDVMLKRMTGTASDQKIMTLYVNALFERDPVAAVEFANSFPWDSPMVDNWRFRHVLDLCAKHPDTFPLQKAVAAVPKDQNYLQRLTSLANIEAGRNPEGAMQWALSITSIQERTAVLHSITPFISDPKAFTASIHSFSNFRDQQMAVQAWSINRMAGKTAADAMSTVLQITEPTLRHTAVATVLERLVQRDPAEAITETVRMIDSGMPSVKLWDMLLSPQSKLAEQLKDQANLPWFNALNPSVQNTVMKEIQRRAVPQTGP